MNALTVYFRFIGGLLGLLLVAWGACLIHPGLGMMVFGYLWFDLMAE